MVAVPADSVENVSSLLAVADAATADDPELLIQANDRSAILRGDAARAVLGLLRALGQEAVVNVGTLPAVLTTGQAADLLGVSRPTVVALIRAGKLPATLVGSTHRRLKLSDVLAYRERQAATRRQALRDLTEISEELGLYDT
jgi:excisionase family DNA binding protein